MRLEVGEEGKKMSLTLLSIFGTKSIATETRCSGKYVYPLKATTVTMSQAKNYSSDPNTCQINGEGGLGE